MPAPRAEALTCRALDRLTDMFPKIVEWAGAIPTLLFFGGESLRAQIELAALDYEALRIPESERRFLYIIRRAPD